MGLSMSMMATLVAALALAGCQSGNKKMVMTESLVAPVEVTDVGKHKRVKTPMSMRKWFTRNGMEDPFAGNGSPYYEGQGAIPKGGGREHLGKPYKVGGRWFTPKHNPSYDKSGMASWYGDEFHSRKTANGEYFNMNDLTAAHPTLPLPSYAKVTNLENGRSVVVRINDRGPFVGDRIIDLSKKTADTLNTRKKGKARVRVQYIGPAPLNDSGKHLQAMNKRLINGASVADLREGGRSASDTQFADALPVKKRKIARPVDDDTDQALIVQVAVYKNAAKAKEAMEQALAYGNSSIVKGKLDGEIAYRVQMGPYASKAQAVADLEEVQASGYLNAKILKVEIAQVAAKVQ